MVIHMDCLMAVYIENTFLTHIKCKFFGCQCLLLNEKRFGIIFMLTREKKNLSTQYSVKLHLKAQFSAAVFFSNKGRSLLGTPSDIKH